MKLTTRISNWINRRLGLPEFDGNGGELAYNRDRSQDKYIGTAKDPRYPSTPKDYAGKAEK